MKIFADCNGFWGGILWGFKKSDFFKNRISGSIKFFKTLKKSDFFQKSDFCGQFGFHKISSNSQFLNPPQNPLQSEYFQCYPTHVGYF
jgi:hypothetical protein